MSFNDDTAREPAQHHCRTVSGPETSSSDETPDEDTPPSRRPTPYHSPDFINRIALTMERVPLGAAIPLVEELIDAIEGCGTDRSLPIKLQGQLRWRTLAEDIRQIIYEWLLSGGARGFDLSWRPARQSGNQPDEPPRLVGYTWRAMRNNLGPNGRAIDAPVIRARDSEQTRLAARLATQTPVSLSSDDYPELPGETPSHTDPLEVLLAQEAEALLLEDAPLTHYFVKQEGHPLQHPDGVLDPSTRRDVILRETDALLDRLGTRSNQTEEACRQLATQIAKRRGKRAKPYCTKTRRSACTPVAEQNNHDKD